ncbi:unnamed protein product, partial [Symbiodinium sp. KB8]
MPHFQNGLTFVDVQKVSTGVTGLFSGNINCTFRFDESGGQMTLLDDKMKPKVAMQAHEVLSLEADPAGASKLAMVLHYKLAGGPIKGTKLRLLFPNAEELRAFGSCLAASGTWPVYLENQYCCPEQWNATLHDVSGELELCDLDTTNPQEPFTCSLSQLSAVKQHAIEDTALQLSFDAPDKASGVRKISRSTARKIVLNFQCPASRAEFTGVLQAACKLAGAAPTLVHDWLEPVPSTAWARFCTNRWPVGSTVLSRPAPRVVLVNASRRLLNIVKQGAGEDDLVRGNAVVEQVIALAPGRLQLERSCSDETRVTVCVSGPEASIAGRAKGGPGITAVTFEFASHGDRERFCAHCALAIAEPEDAAEAAASLGAAAKLAVPVASSASEGGATQGGHAEAAGGKEQDVAATLHAYASAVSSLYGREWPQRTISVEVATFNAGGKPPSSDAAALGSWIPLPHTAVVKGVPSGGASRRRTSLAHRGRSTSEVSAPTGTFDGTPDLVVIGLQEIGGQRNRDLWGAALLGHLNACAAGAAAGPVAGRATLTKH